MTTRISPPVYMYAPVKSPRAAERGALARRGTGPSSSTRRQACNVSSSERVALGGATSLTVGVRLPAALCRETGQIRSAAGCRGVAQGHLGAGGPRTWESIPCEGAPALMRGGETVTRCAHNAETPGSIPGPAMDVDAAWKRDTQHRKQDGSYAEEETISPRYRVRVGVSVRGAAKQPCAGVAPGRRRLPIDRPLRGESNGGSRMTSALSEASTATDLPGRQLHRSGASGVCGGPTAPRSPGHRHGGVRKHLEAAGLVPHPRAGRPFFLAVRVAETGRCRALDATVPTPERGS